MKITKKQFERIIQEELRNYIQELQLDEAWYHKAFGLKSPEEKEEEARRQKELQNQAFDDQYNFGSPKESPSWETKEKRARTYIKKYKAKLKRAQVRFAD